MNALGLFVASLLTLFDAVMGYLLIEVVKLQHVAKQRRGRATKDVRLGPWTVALEIEYQGPAR